MTARVGILHPGAMGGAVGAALVASGVEVAWASEGRSMASAGRAAGAGLVDAGSIRGVIAWSEVVLCICPPDAAVDVARSVVGAGFGGTYVDANAVSPATAARIAEIVESGGATFVDGDIIGGPPRRGGPTRLYLSGPAAAQVAPVLKGPGVESVVLDGDLTAASALKMSYAAWTKGSAALLLAIRAAARRLGVEDALLAEWDRTQPGLVQRSNGAAGSVPKAWRFIGEMEEIAATFSAAGLPDGFARAAADVYRRLEQFKDTETTLDEALAALLAR